MSTSYMEPPCTVNVTVNWPLPKPVKVYINGKYTIVEWSDGEKTKAGVNDEEWDTEKGVAMAIARRLVGRGEFERLVNEAHDQRQ